MFGYPIAISLSPNTEKEDVYQALKILIQPWRWKRGNSQDKAEAWFKQYFNLAEAVFFNSGRSALYSVLKVFGIGEGDEVLIQAFTCVAVPNSIVWTGAKPVYVDCDDALNIDPQLLEESISHKTKAIIVQHTFGIPADLVKIGKVAQKHNLILIEDCAHSLGASFNGKKIGRHGDAAIFSFGRDKVLSSVFGGMAIISSKFKVQSSKLREFQQKLDYPSCFWIFQQILHPITFAVILPLYNCFVGKVILALLQKLRLLSKAVEKNEKQGERPDFFPAKYPDALACLLITQLEKLEKYNARRIKLAEHYYKKLKRLKGIKLPPFKDGAIYLRFNILSQDAKNILSQAERKGVFLGNWYKNTIDPKGVVFERVNYKKGSCEKAEEAARLSVNLPTFPRLKSQDCLKVIELVKKTLED